MDLAKHMDNWISSKNGKVETSTSQVYAMLTDLEDQFRKEMKEKMIPNLQKFQHQYPQITSADLQTFILGYQAAIDTLNYK